MLTVLAARVHDLLGLSTLVVGGIGVVVALLRLRRTVTNCRDLAEQVALLLIWVISVFAHVALRIGIAWQALTGTRNRL